MTTAAPAPVAESLTTEGRRHRLLDLHHQDLPLIKLIPALREYAHPCLPWEQVTAGWDVHEEAIAKVNALRSGANPENYPEAGVLEAWDEDDRRQEAIWRLEEQAREVLHGLASGE